MGLDERLRITRNRTLLERWQLPLVVIVVSIALLFGDDVTRDWLRFERAGIARGELWRLLSGHLVHLGPSHVALNLAGLCLAWYLVREAFAKTQWWFVLAFGVSLIDAGFWFLNPELQWYVGLSGVLHTLLVAGVVAAAGKEHRELIVIGILVAAKIGWEQVAGPLPGSVESSGGAVIVDAHLYGSVAGVLAGLFKRIRVRRSVPI